jgi:glycosyltransferase involved in cell wall biosynthesis
MNVSIVIPFINQKDITIHCLEKLVENSVTNPHYVLIDNGSFTFSDSELHELGVKNYTLVENKANTGVLPTFKQALEYVPNGVLCFMHNDVLIHEKGWDQRVSDAFESDEKLGLVGLLGARGVMPDGGRVGVMSHMLGKEWGKTEGAQPAAIHHGELMMELAPASVLDGVGMFFRKETLQQLNDDTDSFSPIRAPHHFYDRILTLKCIDLGWHVAVLGIQFDHWSGATANQSKEYHEFGARWCREMGQTLIDGNADLTIYKYAEKQFFDEWMHRLPLFVQGDYNYDWARQ